MKWQGVRPINGSDRHGTNDTNGTRFGFPNISQREDDLRPEWRRPLSAGLDPPQAAPCRGSTGPERRVVPLSRLTITAGRKTGRPPLPNPRPLRSGAVTGAAYRGAMPQVPRCTGRQVVRALLKLGWVVATQRGSHVQLMHPTRGGRVTVPVHSGETLGPGLLRSILSQAGLTADELRAGL
ncbi:MAG: type II toxin-antitoxin system HicA family toxin [Acidimicrobiales bacterium]